jgi:carboxymethylenebutenolidase
VTLPIFFPAPCHRLINSGRPSIEDLVMPHSRSPLRAAVGLLACTWSLAMLSACTQHAPSPDVHADHGSTAPAVRATSASDPSLPAGSADVAQRLASSPRHGEYVMISTGPGDSVRAWVVYPERSSKAPVVVVIHEIYGLSTWIRGVADQLAADGYIAIAPDLLTGKAAPAPGTDTLTQAVATSTIRTLKPEDVQRQLAAVGRYGMALPAAEHSYGVVGFCWGGGTSFAHAVMSPEGLRAAVVYYGTSPALASLSSVRIPVLGLYAGDDARVGATVPPADSAMRAMGKAFDVHSFAGAGHGFLRQQDGKDGANMAATRQAWPLTINFFRKYLGR